MAKDHIAAGTFVAEYVGNIMWRGRRCGHHVMRIGHVYLVIERENSYAGKINNGCDPNCILFVIVDLVAARAIFRYGVKLLIRLIISITITFLKQHAPWWNHQLR